MTATATAPAPAPGNARPVPRGDGFTGTAALVRLATRRDRIVVPVWAAALVGIAASSATATSGLYPTEASRVQAAEAVNGTPALVALYGPVFDPTSLGALAMLKLGTIGATVMER